MTSELEDAFARWTFGLELEFTAAVQADWNLAESYWANLIGPDPLPFTDMVHSIAAEHDA